MGQGGKQEKSRRIINNIAALHKCILILKIAAASAWTRTDA